MSWAYLKCSDVARRERIVEHSASEAVLTGSQSDRQSTAQRGLPKFVLNSRGRRRCKTKGQPWSFCSRAAHAGSLGSSCANTITAARSDAIELPRGCACALLAPSRMYPVAMAETGDARMSRCVDE